jgi:chromosome transmission fidelity protein 8
MVQLFVRMPGGGREWGMVELQGQLETRDQVPFNSMHIGDLHFDSRGTPSLIVGHHLLTGKIMTLDKPFAVLRKKSKAISSDEWEMGMEPQPTAVAGGTTEYEVVALITKKIIFKNRPKPIITKPLPRKQ